MHDSPSFRPVLLRGVWRLNLYKDHSRNKDDILKQSSDSGNEREINDMIRTKSQLQFVTYKRLGEREMEQMKTLSSDWDRITPLVYLIASFYYLLTRLSMCKDRSCLVYILEI